MYQGYFFPLSHFNSHTLYYMYINSKSGCNRCPKCEILKARKQKKRNRGREIAKITDKRYLHKT